MSQKKKNVVKYCSLCLKRMAIWKPRGKRRDVKKRIGIAKFSSAYKSNNKFETCPMTFAGKRRI
jgi:hypothetical protein